MSPGGALQVLSDIDQAAVLMDPVRLRLVGELVEPDSASGLARRLGLPRQRLNYHLRSLERAGLVRLVGERRRRNCTERMLQASARCYVIDPAVLGRLGDRPGTIRDRFSWSYLVAVASRAIRELVWLRRQADRAGQRLATLTLDVQVRLASPQRLNAFAEELSAALAQLIDRYHDETAAGGRLFRCIAAMHPAITKGPDAYEEAPAAAGGTEIPSGEPAFDQPAFDEVPPETPLPDRRSFDEPTVDECAVESAPVAAEATDGEADDFPVEADDDPIAAGED